MKTYVKVFKNVSHESLELNINKYLESVQEEAKANKQKVSFDFKFSSSANNQSLSCLVIVTLSEPFNNIFEWG